MSADDVLQDMHEDLLADENYGVHDLTYTAPDGTETSVTGAWFREERPLDPARTERGEQSERRAVARWRSAIVTPELRGIVTYDSQDWTVAEPPLVRDGAARVELVRALTTERSAERYRKNR
jgi:hypothetical protein